MTHQPIAWTIAGSDSGGGAGIQADLHTFHALGVHGCSVIAALTAQNSQAVQRIEFCSPAMITAQITALADDLPPGAIKLGMVGSLETLKTILPLLRQFSVPIIYDPVITASSGATLHQGELREFLLQHFLPQVTLLTPNIAEAEWLLAKKIINNDDMTAAAQELYSYGVKAVLLKGGHALGQKNNCQDFFYDGLTATWLTSDRQTTLHNHGSGCTLASAIAACLALDYSLIDACVIAKMYVNQGLRLAIQMGKGVGHVAHAGWPTVQSDLPWLTTSHSFERNLFKFATVGQDALGIYPIVDNFEWLERFIKKNVSTIQLRIKDKIDNDFHSQLKKAIVLAKQYNTRLFVNDDWRTAIELGAYGVHLGQEDLLTADCAAIANAGLRLGISTHSYAEIARAHAYRPSYMAVGAIFHTTTKQLPTAPQGVDNLRRYCQLLDYPVVAIGGIQWEHLPALCEAGANGIAVISAMMKADDPEVELDRWKNAVL